MKGCCYPTEEVDPEVKATHDGREAADVSINTPDTNPMATAKSVTATTR